MSDDGSSAYGSGSGGGGGSSGGGSASGSGGASASGGGSGGAEETDDQKMNRLMEANPDTLSPEDRQWVLDRGGQIQGPVS